ncbi:MAG: DUF349 domain-containing protein [Bacteroidaceae bacterium]|nr:DUF349 domain-containing protein [Bacteroidaceae bacterium]MBO4841264.1 DUF349 domain-containing protein [Bacteroidaceae bacterium]
MMDSLETNVTTATEQSSEINAAPAVPVYTTKEEVVNRVKEIAQSEELAEKQELDLLKQLFYKFHNNDIQEARNAFIEGGGEPEKFEPQIDPLEPEFRASMQLIRDRRAAAQEELERQKQENLKRKLEILDRIQQLASTPEEANNAFDEFKALQTEWKEIKQVPAERATELWKNYQLYVEQFYDLLKLGHELRDYDFRKNLEAKTRLCEEAEALIEAPEVVAAYNQMLILNQEWKETGPVARELREEIWNRFKAATTAIYKRHQDFFEARKAKEEENLNQKTALCEQIEAISTDDLKTSSDWDEMTKKIIEMQATWKTIGFAPQKMNTAIFERFRKGCDVFFEKKAQFFQALKESLNENLAKKKELVEKAESLKDSTDWRSTGDILVKLQKQWKEIGNVPHKYSEDLWKRFVGACDHFFEARQQATAGIRDEQNANKEEKLNIIERLKELASKEGEEIIQEVKELQKKWNEVGHVPFRDKDKLYKDYREVCDKIYGALSASQAKRHLNNFRNNLAQKIEKEGGSLSNERQRMMRAYERMRDELNTYENNLGFLSSNSKKGNSLVDSMKKKVEKLRDELSLLAQKIKAVDEQIANEGKEFIITIKSKADLEFQVCLTFWVVSG